MIQKREIDPTWVLVPSIPVKIGTVLQTVLEMDNDPMAPLTTALQYEGEDTFLLRVMSFERADEESIPALYADASGLKYYVVYDAVLGGKPDPPYNGWYFAAPNQKFVNREIRVYNHDDDPKTSRGTITIVQPVIKTF